MRRQHARLFVQITLLGKAKDCCDDLFNARSVMRRGLCYQTRRYVNQVNPVIRSSLFLEILDRIG
jgi:hypothetical protein